MIWDEETQKQFNVVRIIGVAMLGVAPLIYLAITYLLTMPAQAGGQFDMILYILLILAVFQPAIYPVIEKIQVSAFLRNPQSQMKPAGLYTSLSIISYAFVEAIYLYGLINFLLTGDRMLLLYFYPIGIVWSLKFWPRRSKFEDFMQRIETHVPNIIE